MCGGHGTYHLLSQIVSGLSEEQDGRYASSTRASGTSADMVQEVKLMYARGEIDTETFHRMIDLARGGHLDWGIISSIHSPPAKEALQTGWDMHPETLAQQRHLQEARAETEQALLRLETELARLYTLAADAEAKAQLAESGSEHARAYQETKQGALFRALPVGERVASLRGSLQRIEARLSELAEHETRLKAGRANR